MAHLEKAYEKAKSRFKSPPLGKDECLNEILSAGGGPCQYI